MTPGMKSSEFGLAVLTIIAAVVLSIAGEIDGSTAMTAIAGVTGAYGLSRGLAKTTSGGTVVELSEPEVRETDV